MAQLISASINLSKIDKSKIIEGKEGAKYLNIQIALNDQADNYGNTVAITINQTKEEREAKMPKIYLGNGKVVWTSNNQNPPIQSTPTSANIPVEDDLPF